PALPTFQRAELINATEIPLRVAACVVMGKEGEKHIQKLLCDPTTNHEVRVWILRALASHPNLGTDTIKLLVELLSDKNDSIRCQAAWVLPVQGPAAAEPIPALVRRSANPRSTNCRARRRPPLNSWRQKRWPGSAPKPFLH